MNHTDSKKGIDSDILLALTLLLPVEIYDFPSHLEEDEEGVVVVPSGNNTEEQQAKQ